jgi:hypothetical protein
VSQTNWVPGLVVLAIGVLAAVAYLLWVRKSASPSAASDQFADLNERAQRLVDQLKELQADRHHLDDRQFAAEKQRLELEAAAALKLRDERARRAARAPAPKAESSRPQSWLSAHPQLKGALWGAGVALFFVALGIFLSQEQKPRTEGQAITGQTPGGGGAEQGEDPQLKALMARLAAEPENVELLALAGHEMISREQWGEAGRLTDRALGIDPFNVENRIHKAFLKAVRGDPAGSMRDLEHLANSYPDSEEALLFLGSLAMQSGNPRGALEAFERYAADAPPDMQPPRLKQAISSLRKQLGLPSN